MAEQLQRIENKVFENEFVEFDGKSFHGCTFKNCVIHYSGGIFEVGNGVTFPNSKITISGAAKNSALFFESLGLIPAGKLSGLA
ncbi:MAG TPA: hypothetical protein VKS20_08465 [Candidatus Acidoferrales bacterium]|nr:hypothetical protein [Candidatus Acidoferrales bacterium]